MQRRHKNKQPAHHPWMVAGERVKRQRMRRIAAAIAKLRRKPTPEPRPC